MRGRLTTRRDCDRAVHGSSPRGTGLQRDTFFEPRGWRVFTIEGEPRSPEQGKGGWRFRLLWEYELPIDLGK